MRSSNPLRAISAGVFFLFLALAFFVSHVIGALFLPVLFVGLAITALIGSFSTLNPRHVYSGVYGFIWFLGLAFCFLFGFWPWILVVIGVTLILGALTRPIMASLMGMGMMAQANSANNAPQPPYQQPYQQPNPYPEQNPYQQGYQPPSTPESYREGGKQYQYPSPSYEQPQSHYPQELPPQ